MEITNNKEIKETAETIDETKQAHKIWIGTYVLLSLGGLAMYALLAMHIITIFQQYHAWIQRGALCTFLAFAILSVAKYAEVLIGRYGHAKAVKYNLVRLVRILSVMAICMVVIAFLFENWYTAAVSLGLFSLVLGFALQTPISSFIGWLYIIIRNPYKVGDRIQVGDFKGDVVEIGYLDTTLWEFSGDYLTNDLPSGRLIRFPNTLVLQSEVYNYSWRKFPYIWNEIPFHIAYESDFAYVEATLKQVAKEVLGPDMDDKVKELKLLVQQTPVDELTIKEYPFVTFRINANTWVEAAVNYLVNPKQATTVRTDIIKRSITALLQQPDKVKFPNGNSR